jgi:hypothetical protein
LDRIIIKQTPLYSSVISNITSIMSSASVNSSSQSSNSDDVSVGEYTPLDNEEQDQSIAKGGVTTP